MEDEEREDEQDGQHDHNGQEDAHRQRGHLLFGGDVGEQQDDLDEIEQEHQSQAEHEKVEVFIVTLAYAVADPGAVVVEPLNAHVAVVAVGRPRRPEDVTGRAKLHFVRKALHGNRVEDTFVVADRVVLVL